MSDHPVPDGGSRIRHALRTRLNHIVGFSDILRQDAEEAGRDEQGEDFARVRDAALALREPLGRRFGGRPERDGRTGAEAPPSPDELARLEEASYALLYDLIGVIQGAKRRAESAGDRDLASDVERILEAANAILELLAAELGSAPGSEPAAAPEGGPIPEPSAPEGRAGPTGKILVVDDNLFNRELLARHLERQGHEVSAADDGVAALEALRAGGFDVVILDVMMPGMNGYQLLERIKADPRLSDLRVIVISALGDTQSVARCIQLGAEDYLPREFEPVVLKARIESCLEKKRLEAERELYVAALVEAQDRIRAELRGGAAYVRSLLPARLSRPGLRTDWLFVPSASLGGDVFGYNEIPGGKLALYLVDVSGHGIESALFSCTLLNMLKSRILADTDFGDPASVLGRLNSSFRIEDMNSLYFTAWYGVWDPESRELAYASAGSPPAVLVLPGGGAVELATGGMLIGLDPEERFGVAACRVAPGSRLYLFSDGIYEFRGKDGGIFGLEPFIQMLSAEAAAAAPGASALEAVLGAARSKSAKARFLDDVSLVEFAFD